MSRSLEDKLRAQPSPAHMLQNAQAGRYAFPIAPEFSNWFEEQRAWRESAVLFDQSVHMTDLYVRGSDTAKLLSYLGVNSFSGFGRNKAKQIVCCSHAGYVIGDAIVFGLEDDEASIVGRPAVPNWVQFHAETGNWEVEVERDDRLLDANGRRKTYRYEVQGPNALAILEAANEGGPLTTRFFNMGEIVIAGRRARTLAHGMGGAKGLEIFGPAEDGPGVLEALLEAGREHGLLRAGARAYSTASAESGWFPSPLPAIYTGEEMKPYREWLSDTSFEAVCSVGGSFQPQDVEEYYLTPYDIGYGRLVKFDHDFIGREALEAKVNETHLEKVTLVWSKESVLEIFAGLMNDGEVPKIMEMPSGHYSLHPFDRVEVGGALKGVSINPTYTANIRSWFSLAMVQPEFAVPGTQVDVIWGEPNGGTAKPAVERHRQIKIRAEVRPWPIHDVTRSEYRKAAPA